MAIRSFGYLFFLTWAFAAARELPHTVKDFYDRIRQHDQCSHVLKGGFHSVDGDPGSFDYCGDYLYDYKVIYLQGRNGQLVNMDVDCNGLQNSHADDGRCGSFTSSLPSTTFAEIVRSYSNSQHDLDPFVHPYIVFGNSGKRPGYTTFDPRQYGVEPLSVVAVVCNNKLIYGVWGDENNDDGDMAMIGEASISLATACFDSRVNGNSGHDDNDILYIAFIGKDAVPGSHGAQWNAQNFTEFENSITALGDKLIQRIRSGSGPDD